MEHLPPPDASRSTTAAYDETPYPCTSFPQTHPDKLCALARLFGLNAPEPTRARVLELGCGDGANLLPMAQHAPEARFVGIDGSARHVAQTPAAIGAAGLQNIEIRHQDILEFSPAEGKFDYIIAHGVYSWVPERVREKILLICRDHLAENGVAYVSYNTFPGWGMRMALRDMLLFHTAAIPDSKSKVQQARALTAFLAEAVPNENSPYGMLLKQELEMMKEQTDNYLRHDIMGEINEPCYFHQFITQAARVGLQYLAEPSLSQMLATNLAPKVKATLDKIGSNIIAVEQYMDFVRNRTFRQTLLCHRAVPLNRSLSPESIKPFYYSSVLAKPDAGALDLRPGVRHVFKVRNSGRTVDAAAPLLKAAFDTLADCAIKRISFSELLHTAREKSASYVEQAHTSEHAADEEAAFAQHLLHLYTHGMIDIFAARPAVVLSTPERPRATPLARFQAGTNRYLTNLAHHPMTMDLQARHMVAACDGRHDQASIAQSVLDAIKEGRLRLHEDGKPIDDEARIRRLVPDRVRETLPRIASAGFFTE